MKKFRLKKEMLIGATILTVLIIDILIKLRIVHTIFVVNENYIFYVFSALCTVATLGSAFISIVINIFSNKCLGFSMKEILNFHSSKIKVSNIIKTSLSIMVIAIPLLAIEFTNTITVFAIYIASYIFLKNEILWRLITNDDKLKSAIRLEIEEQSEYVNEEIIINWFNRWFYELKISIENKDEKQQYEYLELIKIAAKKCTVNHKKNALLRLEYLIGEMFKFASHELGFVDAYRKIILMNEANQKDIDFDIRTIIYKSIKYLEYSEEKEISQANIVGNITDIIWELELDQDIKFYILYQFYSVIFTNIVIRNNFKFSLLNLCFEEICCFSSNQKNNEVLSKTILYIFKDGVLQNEDKKSRQKLYLTLLKSLFVKNIYSKEKLYILTISKIFRALYFYAFLETETIKKEYRTELQGIIDLKIDSMDNILISLPRIIHENSDCIIEQLIEDVVSEEYFDMFDYFPKGFGAKSPVFTRDMKLQFVFWIYSIFGHRSLIFPVKEYFDDPNIFVETKQFICNIILSMFSVNQTLDSRTMENIKNLRISLKTNLLLPEEYFRETFKFFNNKLKEIRRIEYSLKPPQIYLSEVNEELTKLMQQYPIFEISHELTANGEEYQILPKYIHADEKTKSSARRIQNSIKDIVNMIIENILPEIQLEFNINGVSTLLNKLDKAEILFRNYTFVDDLAFDKNAIGTPEYEKLCQKISSIKYTRTNAINQYVFLAIEGVKVNAEVISYKRNILSHEECDKYTELFKIADGKYRIDGVVYNKSEGIQIVKDSIRIESAIVKIKTNISKNSGFRVVFKR